MKDDYHISLLIGGIGCILWIGLLVFGQTDFTSRRGIFSVLFCGYLVLKFLIRGIRGYIEEKRRIKKIMEDCREENGR